MYLFADVVRENCVNGMSILFDRKNFLKKGAFHAELSSYLVPVGGLRQFANFLAEDYFMSRVNAVVVRGS